VHGRDEEWHPGRTRNETWRDGDGRLSAGPPALQFCFFALFGAHFGAFLSFFIAVGVPVQIDNFGVVDEAIDERDNARRVREDVIPLGERLVGSDDGAFGLVASANEFEESDCRSFSRCTPFARE
jgi:hypothetical protein